MKIEGVNIIVTGAARGIGLALCEELHTRGASLHRVVRGPIRDKIPGKVWTVDMLKADEVQDFAREFLTQFGAPGGIINNAGLLTGGLLEDQEPASILDMLTVNLTHLILLTRLFLPAMLRARRGKIVNNASVSGRMYFPCASTYAASKAGVLAFTECLKQELRGTGVSSLLLVTPGIQTEMYEDIKKRYGDHLDVSFLSSIPAGEWAKRVCEAIEDDRDTLEPQGLSRVGLSVAHHIPKIFEKLVATKFSRRT